MTGTWIKKVIYMYTHIHIAEFYVTIKNNEIILMAGDHHTKEDHNSERTVQKDNYHVFSHSCILDFI